MSIPPITDTPVTSVANIKAPGKSGISSVDEESMEHLKTQVEEGSEIDKILDACMHEAHLNKLLGTYIKGIMELTDENCILHPSFNLNIPVTYRSSSSDPNFQNLPVRNPILSRMRKTMVPQNDWFLEVDYASAEVRVIAMYSQDRNLIKFILDGYNFHRYYAALLYEKPEERITPMERYNAKNKFVFPEFYGSWYKSIAKGSPDWSEAIVEKAEKIFWKDLSGVKRWQQKELAFYERFGYTETKLGFRFRAPLARKDMYNYPIQGTAFHRLLKAAIDADRAFDEASLKSWLCGQIHDSIVVDVVDSEIEQVMDILEHEMTKKIWDWEGNIPMESEFKIGRNLIDMEAL